MLSNQIDKHRRELAKNIFENRKLTTAIDLQKKIEELTKDGSMTIQDLTDLCEILQSISKMNIQDEFDISNEIRKKLKSFFCYLPNKEDTILDLFFDEISMHPSFNIFKWLSNTLNNFIFLINKQSSPEEKKKHFQEFPPILKDSFNKKESYYTISRDTATKYSGKTANTFDDIREYIATSPAYKDPTSRIIIDNDHIYIGHSLKEMTASFPDLKKKLLTKNNIELTEKNLSRDGYPAISNWNISFNNPIENRQNEIKQKAKTFYKIEKALSPVIPEVTHLSTDTLLENLLKTQPIIAIGEDSHEDPTAKLWLANKMPSLKKAGVDTIYIEHLLHDTQKNLLKNYYESKNASMPIMLKNYLSHLDKQFKLNESNGFLNLVIQAKLNGIRIIPIDTEASYHTPQLHLEDYKKDASGRHIMMNYEATRIIKEHESEPTKKGKSIIFCGSGHLNQVTQQAPGLRQLIGCATIIPQNYLSNNQKEEIISRPKHEGKPDFIVYIDPLKSSANILETKISSEKIPATISLLRNLLSELTEGYVPKNLLSQKKLELLNTCDSILSKTSQETIVNKILPYIIAIALQATAFQLKNKTQLGHNLRELLKKDKFNDISKLIKHNFSHLNHVKYRELRIIGGSIQEEKNVKQFFSSNPKLHLNNIEKELNKIDQNISQFSLKS